MKHSKSKKRDSSNSSDSSHGSGSSDRHKKPRKRSPEHDNNAKNRGRSDSRERRNRREAEHSKWDSPERKIDRKRKVEHSEARDRAGRSDDNRRRNVDEHHRRHDDRYDSRNRDRSKGRSDNREGRDKRRDEADNRDRDRRDEADNRDRDRRDEADNRDRDRSDGRNRRDDYDRRRNQNRRRRSRSASFDHSNARWGRGDDGNQNNSKNPKSEKKDKEKPNFSLSGKLTEETNTYRGVVIKYSEPPEARKPKRRWRLYPFKGEKAMQTLYIHRESAYLIGRDRKVVDLAVDHPSCSKQHAALQYRLVSFTRDDGSTGKKVRPYLIDLESANGTFLNNKKVDPKKYIELFEKDVIKFGFSSREYVLLHENSKGDALDDDVKMEEVEVKKEED